MQEQYHAIGETAGKIYKALENNNEEKTVNTLQKEIKVSDPELVHQALGWLAREGKLNLKGAEKNLKVSLATVGV